MTNSETGQFRGVDESMDSANEARDLANVVSIEAAPSHEAGGEAWMSQLGSLHTEIARKRAEVNALMSVYQMAEGENGVLQSVGGGRADAEGVRKVSEAEFELNKLQIEYRDNPRREDYERRLQAETVPDQAA